MKPIVSETSAAVNPPAFKVRIIISKRLMRRMEAEGLIERVGDQFRLTEKGSNYGRCS